MILILLVVYWNISKRIKIIMGRRWEWRVCSHLQRRSVGKSIFLPKNRRNLWIFIRKLQCPSIIPLRNLLAPFIVVLRLLMTSGMFLSFPSFTTLPSNYWYIYIYIYTALRSSMQVVKFPDLTLAQDHSKQQLLIVRSTMLSEVGSKWTQ